MLDKSSEIPYYLQIYDELKKRIERGFYKANCLLPSENELVKEFDVTRATIRNAVKKLKDEGRIYTQKGKGSFVCPPKIEQSLFRFYSFGRDYSGKDFNVQSQLVSSRIDLYDEAIQQKLGLNADEAITKVIRLRKLDGIPVIIESAYMPTALVPGITAFDLEKCSIYDLLEQHYGLKLQRAKEYLDPCVTDSSQSELLEVEECTPVFITERLTYSTAERPIEYRHSIIRGDHFRFSVEFR